MSLFNAIIMTDTTALEEAIRQGTLVTPMPRVHDFIPDWQVQLEAAYVALPDRFPLAPRVRRVGEEKCDGYTLRIPRASHSQYIASAYTDLFYTTLAKGVNDQITTTAGGLMRAMMPLSVYDQGYAHAAFCVSFDTWTIDNSTGDKMMQWSIWYHAPWDMAFVTKETSFTLK